MRTRALSLIALCGLPAAGAPLAAAGALLPPTAAPTPCTATVFPLAGRIAPTRRRGPGLLLSGGGVESMPDIGLAWMRAHFGTSARGRAGNVVVLRASGGREYTDRFYRVGRFASVREILLPPCLSRTAVAASAVGALGRADAVIFAGGDQANYARWTGGDLLRAVKAVYARGGIVGGGSAGLAIQGAFAYDSVAADRLHADDFTVHTRDAVANPLEAEISFSKLFAWPPLRRTMTDTHFVERDRFGRTVAFLARAAHDGLATPPLYALGVDRGSVVLVEPNGMATVRIAPKSGGAYLVRMSKPPVLVLGQPLRTEVEAVHFGRDGARFDLARKAPNAHWRRVMVDGARIPPYDRDPYR